MGFFFDCVKKTLFIHPIITVNFTHVTRSVVWKNDDNNVILFEFSYFIKLFDRLQCSPRGITYKKSFFSGYLTGAVGTVLVSNFDK